MKSKAEQIVLRCTREQKNQMKLVADRQGLDLSSYIRLLVLGDGSCNNIGRTAFIKDSSTIRYMTSTITRTEKKIHTKIGSDGKPYKETFCLAPCPSCSYRTPINCCGTFDFIGGDDWDYLGVELFSCASCGADLSLEIDIESFIIRQVQEQDPEVSQIFEVQQC